MEATLQRVQAGPSQKKGAELVASVKLSEKELDLQLVRRVQGGDKKAFELLFSKYQRRVNRLVSRFVRSDEEAEDIVQDSFIKAYRALPAFRGDSAFYTWLYRIAVNTAKNYLVSASRRPHAISDYGSTDEDGFREEELVSHMNTPESELVTREIAETVNSTMAELPGDLREAITLREIEGLSYEEIAEVMGCPIGTVRSRIFRAREAISEKIKPMLDVGEGKRW